MLLFRYDHIQPILSGVKTQTRRLWNRPRVRVGTVHLAKTKIFGPPFASLKIKSIRRERVLDISEKDAIAEGYKSREDFLGAFRQINKLKEVPEDMEVWVVEFELVKENQV